IDPLPLYVCLRSIIIYISTATATTYIYTLSLHDALPISRSSIKSERLIKPKAIRLAPGLVAPKSTFRLSGLWISYFHPPNSSSNSGVLKSHNVVSLPPTRRLLLLVIPCDRIPHFTPISLVKSVVARTIRASTITCLTCTSSRSTIFRILSIKGWVSFTIIVLVRASIDTEPRELNKLSLSSLLLVVEELFDELFEFCADLFWVISFSISAAL